MSEYLSEEEQVARLRSWWDDNGTSLIVTIAIAVSAVIGWNWYSDRSITQMHAASDAYIAYLDGADDAIGTITGEHEGSSFHILVLFDQAKDAVEEGDLVQAEALLEAATELGGSPILGDMAHIRLARVQQGLDRSEAALATLTRVGSAGYTSYALEVKGDIHSARGELEAAYESYQAAIDALREGEDRPLLTMKLNNAAPYGTEFVKPQNSLNDALEAAQEALETELDTIEEDEPPVQASEPRSDESDGATDDP